MQVLDTHDGMGIDDIASLVSVRVTSLNPIPHPQAMQLFIIRRCTCAVHPLLTLSAVNAHHGCIDE